MAQYIIRCRNGYYVFRQQCVKEESDATRIKYLAQAKAIVNELNKTGYCGAGCSIYTLSTEARNVIDKATGVTITILSDVAKKYGA